MVGENILLVIAQVGIVFAGLTSVAEMFLRMVRKDCLPQDVTGMRFMIGHSLGASFLALVPSILFYFRLSDAWVWGPSSALLCFFLLFKMLIQIKRIFNLTSAGFPPRKLMLLVLTYFPCSVGAMGAQFYNFITWRGVAPFLVGLTWLLLASTIQFYVFLSEFQSRCARD